MTEEKCSDSLRRWGFGFVFCVLSCSFGKQPRLEDVLRTAVSPVNFGIRQKWEVVHARDGDPVCWQMTANLVVTGSRSGREGEGVADHLSAGGVQGSSEYQYLLGRGKPSRGWLLTPASTCRPFLWALLIEPALLVSACLCYLTPWPPPLALP